jgi:hypothetical protein
MAQEWNSRFLAYCDAMHGGADPETVLARDRKTYPGGRMAGFLCWNSAQITAWRKETGHGENTPLDHDAYDAWLAERVKLGDDLGYSLDHLRVLTGRICSSCLGSDGLVVVATITEDYSGWSPSQDFCESCHDREAEGSWAASCEDYYGGSAPQTQREQAEAAERGMR